LPIQKNAKHIYIKAQLVQNSFENFKYPQQTVFETAYFGENVKKYFSKI